MVRFLLISFLLATSDASAMPTGDGVHQVIAENDARVFWAAFEGCVAEALSPLLSPDFRMIHDLAGLAVPDRETFIAGITEQCASRAPGGENEGYANRRRATPGSRRVQALGDWGALEEGHHSFFERQADGSWKLTGGARYIHVWQWVGDRFVLTESISVDHGAALTYPPESADKPPERHR